MIIVNVSESCLITIIYSFLCNRIWLQSHIIHRYFLFVFEYFSNSFNPRYENGIPTQNRELDSRISVFRLTRLKYLEPITDHPNLRNINRIFEFEIHVLSSVYRFLRSIYISFGGICIKVVHVSSKTKGLSIFIQDQRYSIYIYSALYRSEMIYYM